jgi:hypothetical protein
VTSWHVILSTLKKDGWRRMRQIHPGESHLWGLLQEAGRSCVVVWRRCWGAACLLCPTETDPEVHPNHPRKQETKNERNKLATRSALTWYPGTPIRDIKRTDLGPAVQVPGSCY